MRKGSAFWPVVAVGFGQMALRKLSYAWQDDRDGVAPPEDGDVLVSVHGRARYRIVEVLACRIVAGVHRMRLLVERDDLLEPGAETPVHTLVWLRRSA